MPDIAYKSIDIIQSDQLERLQRQLKFVTAHSKFYQAHFKKHQVDIDQIKSLEELNLIPTIGKKELQAHYKDFWCVAPSQIRDYTNTSGTEGKPVTIPLSNTDLDRLAYNEMLSLACTGGDENEIYQLTTTIDRRFMAGLAYTLGARELGAGMVRTGPGIPQLQWQTIDELNTTALIVVPSFLVKLIDYAINNGIDYKNSSVKKAICIGEPIRNSDFSLNALGSRIKEAWDIELYSTYASSEMATAFTECSIGKGGHVLTDLIVVEILDEKGNKVPEGVAGELTITTLGVEGFPLVRFRTGDICAVHKEPCACGRTTPRLGPVIGRKHQMIKCKGTTCYPSAIYDVMDRIPEISHYQIELSLDNLGNDEVLIRYATNSPLEMGSLVNQLKAGIRFTPKLEALSVEMIMPMIFQEAKRKPVKMVDKRANSL
ncbi:MAG TPA: AMP-binding protein [Fulvivirga sp.]|nr:AMP-binding protein [Fulvivirga sp.]